MAGKYWWEEDDQTKQQSSGQTSSQDTTSQGYWWESDSMANMVGSNITKRVNSWIENHNNYISNYQKRYSGRKYSYEDSYVSDSADWMNTVSEQKKKFDTEAASILDYMDQYQDYLDKDWMKSVRETLTGASGTQAKILESATKDNEWWNSFGSDQDLLDEYGSAEDVYKYFQRSDGYSKKYNGMTSEELYGLVGDLDDGEEKSWLSSYASSVDYDEKGKADLNEVAKDLDDLGNLYDQAFTIDLWYDEYKRGLTPYDAQKIEAYNRLKNEFGGDAKAVKKAYEQKEQYLKSATDIQKLNSLSAVSGNADFGQNSKYVSNVEYGLLGKPEFTDNTYAYINNPTVEDKRALGAGQITARDLIGTEYRAYAADSPLRNRDSSYEREALEYIKPEEVKVYNYLYATEGEAKANEYLDLLVSTFQARKDIDTAQKVSDFTSQNALSAAFASALSVGTSIGSGFEYLEDIIEYGGDLLMGKDAKLGTNESAAVTNAVRGTVADMVDWKIGNWDAFDFLYNTTMSGVDSLASTAFGGAGGAVLGLSAAAQGTNDALQRGMSDGQAFWNGLFSGVFECLFESISLGNFKKLKETAINVGLKNIDSKVIKTFAKNIGKSMLVNASEEMATEIANIAYDTLVNGELANYTLEELFTDGQWKNAVMQVIESGASGALMGMGMSALGSASGLKKGIKAANDYAVENYGGQTDAFIQEGLENDVKSDSYKLATKYQQQVQGKDGKQGKALTGQQIRNLLAANQEQITPNDIKKIQKAAEKRLTDLGQTDDVAKVAELATKRATGQKLTRAEASFLANSQYGARVANELLPENIMSGDYATEWAEGIGTKKVNKLAYNIKSILEEMSNVPAGYKSLEKRVSEEDKFSVSESGQATIRSTGNAIDLSKVEVADFVRDKETGKITDMILKADGKEVKASDIDYADDNQSYLFSAVKHIENITPGDATAFIRDYNPSSGQTAGEYLNGIDEAFTYGYHRYSEADMGAGLFTPKLTSEQAKGAYILGQTTRNKSDTNKSEAIKRMRTAVEAETEKAKAEGKAAPKAKELTITYNEGRGKIRDFAKTGMKLHDKQGAGVEIAQILHKLGLGTNFEFFSSYVSKSMKVKDQKTGEAMYARVFINDAGVEEVAPAGVYRKSDGTIRIDLNAYNGRGLTLNALAHELTHFIQQWSDTKYQVLADFLVKTYEKTDMTMHQRVIAEQARLKDIRGKEVSYNEAYDEVVAKAMMKMFDDGKLAEKLTELASVDKTIVEKLLERIRDLFKKFLGFYNSDVLYKDSDDLVGMKDAFEQLQNMFAEALVEASENFQTSLIAKEAGIDIMPVEDGSMYSYSSLAEAAGFAAVENEDGTRSFTREGKKVSKVTINDIDNSPIGAFINFSLEMGDISEADAERQKKMFADICTMACKTNDFAMTMQFVGSAVFTGMKANADKQYGTTYDFPSICTKTQAVIDAMSAKMVSLGRGLNTKEIVQLYEDVFASGNPVPCPECYVFSRWIGIGGLLDNIKKYQDYYGDMNVKDVAAAYLEMKAEVSKFAEEQGISFGKAKGALTAKLTKEFNKLTEKIEKQQNQGEKVKPADKQRLAELEPMMNTVKSMTWLENVYFADSSLKKVNPNFRVPDSVLFDLNNGEAFATKYKEAWAFRTTQGAGYGKAITPYAEARLGEGVLVTNNTTKTIKGRADGSLDNYFLQQMGKLDKKSRDALKRARMKQKIQAFIGGQRFQSTSDARYENASDYLLAALEMQAMGGMVQVYTKVDGAVPAFSAWGFSINQSLMPLNGGLDADGNVKDTGVGGMNPKVAFENRKKHESAGTITIGVNDNHIRAMFKQLVRDFIIPYHASGGKADTIAEFRRIQEGKEATGKAVRSTDYSRTQSDKVLSDEVLRWQGKTDAQIQRIHEIRNARIAILTGGNPNMTVVRSNRFLSALYEKLDGGEWDGVKLAKSKVESQIFPNEFWDQTVTYEESAKITKDYLEYCEDLGFLHRFSGMIPSNGKLIPANGYNENGERVQLTDLAYKYDEKGNKTAEVEEFFWKVLTDRRMYDNNGKYLAQKVVTLNDTTTDTVTGFAKNNQGREYDKAKAEALAKKITNGEQYSSQETDDTKSYKKEHGDRFSLHDPVESTRDLLAMHNISEKLLWDALNKNGLVMPSVAVTNKGLDAFGEISLLFDKSVIDPAVNKDNKLYGADAWTPMQTSLKMNAKFDTDKTVNAVNSMKDHIGSKYVSELLNITPKQFKEAIIKADGNIYEAYAHNIGVQTAYGMEKGIIAQIPINKDGTVNHEMLQKQLDKTLDTDDGWRQYRRWLNNISDTVITSYDQASNEDVLRHMKAQPATAKTFKLSETGELVVPAKEYSSIKELRRNKNRLSENAEEATKAVAAEFMEFAKKIGDTQQVVEAINAGFESRYNIADIMKAFSNKGVKISSKEAGDLQALYKKAVELPTQYFEAKPDGTIGMEKVNTAVVPDNVSNELRQALEEQGINVIEYKHGVKADRTNAVNSVKELMFSSQETDADGFADYVVTPAVYAIRNEKAKRGHDLVKIGNMPTLYRDLFGLSGDVYVSNEHLYQNMVSRATAEAEGRFNPDASSDYHDLGEVKVINAIEQFQDPLVIMESLKDFKEPRLVAILDEKGNDGENLIAVLELYSEQRPHGVSQKRNHVLITIYEKTSLPDYIEKTGDKDRILHIRKGSSQISQAGLQLAGEISEKILKKNVSRFNKKVKAFKEKNNIQYSSQETDADYIRYDRRAILKESKVDEYLNDYAAWSSPKYAQAYIAYVRPRTFLKLTTDDMLERLHISDRAGKLDAERLSDSRPGIYLRIDHETGKVTGHEGRHRMAAMDSAGIELVPVLLLDTSNKMSKTDIEQIYLHGQFDETAMGIVKDLIPLNYENRDRVIENFATQSSTQRIGERYGLNKTLRFSTQETDNISNRDLLANAFEGLVQNSEEYKLIQEYKGRIRLLNEYEEKLSELNAEIRKLTFGTEGERDSKKLKELQKEAKEVAGDINRNDKILVSLEASEPLRKVIEQERKKEAQKTKAHVKELLKNKKSRAEQTELRHKIRKAVRDLDKLLNRGNKKQNVKEDMKGFVSKALELADYIFTDHVTNDDLIRRGITVRMTPREAALVKETEDILNQLYDNADSLTDEEFTRLDAKRKANEEKLRDLLKAQRNESLNTPVYNLFDDLVSEYASLKNSSQDAVKAAYNEELENSLRAFMSDDDRVKILKNMRVADMTTEELNWLYRAYTMVLTNVRNANKFHVNGMNATIEQVVGQIAGDFGSRKIPDKKLAIAMQKLVNKLGWDYEKLYYALDRIGSEAFTKLIMNIADSENTVMQDVMEAAAFRDKMVETYGFNNWDVNKEIDREFLDNTGKKFKLTLGQLMALYAYSRREGAWDHIEYGGFVFGEAALTNPRPADSYKLSKEQCEAITNLLTKEQKGYAEDMQKYLSETMGAKGNEVSMLLYGIKMFGEKNYFPIHIAGQFKAQAQESQAKAAAGFGSMSNAGFTHAQNPNAKAPFVLEGFNEIWVDHVNEMSRYHGTVPALEDLRRVMNRSTYSDAVAESQSIKQLMENSYGKEAVDYFDNLYREANSGAITDKLQKTSKKLLSMFRKNSVAYSLSVLIQQPTSITRAYAMIDKKYFGFKGFGSITSGVAKAVSDKWTKAHTNAYNEMLKYAPGVTMAKEIGGFDTHTGGSIRSYLLDTKKSLKQKWNTGTAMEKGKAVLDLVDDNAIANLPNLADKIAWIEIWNACKRETVATHKDLAANSEEFMKVVGDRFTEVIRATQVYDSMFAKSPMLKSKNLAVQYLVSFMNEPNTVANMAESALRDAVRGNWKDGVKKAIVLAYGTIAVGMAKSLIYAMRDDDEDETFVEKYIESLTGSLLSDFNPISYIPVARDVLSAAQGYDVERPDMAIVVDAISALNAVIKNNSKDTEGMSEEQLAELDKKVTDANWKLVESLAAFFGIPVKNIRRDVKGVFDHARIASANAGQTTVQSAFDKVYDAVVESVPFMSAPSKQDKLYEAIISGDTEYVNRLKSTYKSDDAYDSAVRKALRENDQRIKEAAQARYDGRTEEYKRIFREIQKEGKFSFDNIMGAINAEVSKLTPDKVSSDYTASEFVESIVLGDTKSAQAIKEDIIATKAANGKSKSEAEKEFATNVATGIKNAYSSGLLDEAGAEKMLMEYADKDEEEAASKVSYWTFCDEHPEYDLSESNVNDYLEFAEPAEIPLDVFAQYVEGTKGLTTKKDEWGDVEVTKREQVLEVIDSLPLTWQQKDALYLAAGYSENQIWDVPW